MLTYPGRSQVAFGATFDGMVIGGCPCPTRELTTSRSNVEGITLGPTLPDGRQSAVLVSDNNFSPSQLTQFLLFAM